MYDIINYPQDSESLLEKFLKEVQIKKRDSLTYNEVHKYLKQLEIHGFDINAKFKKNVFVKITNNSCNHLFELKIRNARIFVTTKDGCFYILNGFYKKSQTTPTKELDMAKKCVLEIHKK